MGRYALLIGTADYDADPQLKALPSVRHDVHQLKAVLDQAGRFDDVSAHLDLPAKAFVQTVEDFYGARRKGDLALFYYSGHGVKHADNQSVFLAASDTVTSGLHATAFDTDGQLRHLLNHTQATHKVVLLDCCFSGSFSARARLSGGMRAEPRRGKHERGTFILTSSTHLEASKVQGPDEPSVFTEVLLDGLRGRAEGGEDGWLTTSELSRYAMAEMARRRRHHPVESSEGVTEAAKLVRTVEAGNAADPAVGGGGDDNAAFDADQWRKLLRYYVACLRRSAVLQSFIDPRASNSYVVFPGGPERVFTAAGPVQLPAQIAKLARQASANGKSLIYGYGVTAVKPQPWASPVLAPLLVCDVNVSPDGALHAVFPPRPHLALADARKLSDIETEQLTERVAQVFTPGDPASLVASIELLMNALGLKQVGAMDPAELTGTVRPAPVDGVQNAAILQFTEDAGGPQRALLQDLEDMIKNPTAISGTALGALAEPPADTPGRDVTVVAPDRLNEAQEEIIAAAMSRRITVAQGPPGTGKSQLVTALLATATAANERVLVGSTGNQAVSSVSDKAIALVGEGLLVRTGNKAVRAAEPELLAGLLSTARAAGRAAPDERTPAGELRIVSTEITSLRAHLDQRRLLERDLADLAPERSAKPPELALPDADEDLARLVELTDRASTSRLLGWWYRWSLRRRYGVRDRAAVEDLGRHACIEARWRDRRAGLSRLPELEKDWRRLTELTGTERPRHSVDLLRAQVIRRVAAGSALLRKRIEELSKDRPDKYACFPELLTPLPGWATTAMSARQFRPTPALFNLVVIDEAAQCTIPAILPMLFRADRALIIGDPRQLQPVVTLSEREDLDLQDRAGLSRRWLNDRGLTFTRHSTYDAFAQSAGFAYLLDEHYRCHPDIIEPANRQVYQGRLTVLTDPRRLNAEADPALRWRHVAGTFERGYSGSGSNPTEVDEVVRQVAESCAMFPDAKIGVVTPLAPQERALQLALRRAGFATAEVTCGTIHKFQGSERDIMVISAVGADGIQGPTRNWLVHQTNLWNVAITRAQSQLVIVGDQSWWSGQRGLLASVAQGAGRGASDHGRPVDAADQLHAALRGSGLTVRRDVSVQGSVHDLVVSGPDRELAVLVDDPAGDPDGRAFRKVLARLDVTGGPASVLRVPVWRCLAQPRDVAAELVADLLS
ncbi:AAA domain-containing protein [Actinoplanes sp. NPDC051494]|uniref:caspase, EACC1-associated type n=1 Tax=Actinoplanes sp. NPDC051494 TaxID=3363907 RepID=UPI0037A81F80